MTVESYNGFSGVNISAWYGDEKFADIQAVSMSPSREMTPIYTMTTSRLPRPRKPAYAGSLIFRKIYRDVPPVMDIELVRSDKDGKCEGKIIIGCELLVEGYSWDPQEVPELDKQYTYIALYVTPWEKIRGYVWNPNG